MPEPARVVVNGERITLPDRAGEETIAIRSITEIAIYKRDEVVTDLICCDIFTADGAVRTVHEDMVGFDDLIAAFEQLPGFAADWYETVVQPAFAENRRVVFTISGCRF